MNGRIAPVTSFAASLAVEASPEKALWYQEVLSLDPNSRIFLPYARLLSKLGRRAEAMDVLKTDPDYVEKVIRQRLNYVRKNEVLYLFDKNRQDGNWSEKDTEKQP